MRRDSGLDALLDLDGETYNQDGDYWIKVEARLCDVTPERPHGISYSLTLHDKHGRRIFGMDNAHAVKPKRRKYGCKKIVEYDHSHNSSKDKGTLYEFETAEKLLTDFDSIKFTSKDAMTVTIKIGIMPKEQYQKRVIDIAAGRYKPKRGEPKIWFSSMKSFAEVMNDRNKVLLDIIRKQKPQSVSELAELSGRHKSNLSRTLKTMEKMGIVELKQKDHSKVPVVTAEQFEVRAVL